MIKKILVLGVSLVSIASAYADGVKKAELLPGQCQSDPLSKTYQSDMNHVPILYSCSYNCLDLNGHTYTVRAAHEYTKTVGAQDDMGGMVCAGVTMEYDDSQGWKDVTVVANSFWAPLSASPEIREAAKEHHVTLPPAVMEEFKKKFAATLNQVASDYSKVDKVQFPEFAAAGEKLALMASAVTSGSPAGTALLKAESRKVLAHTPGENKAENLVLMTLSSGTCLQMIQLQN